tara:strand:+ start:4351 stop:6534 length:2184 start_codon:yes stop_codon:yes gene_type:complete
MRKIIFYLIVIIFFILALLTIILSTTGVETNRFNDFISNKINQNNNNIALKLTTINFKLDLKEISLFLETKNPQISYRNILIPTEKIKVYMDFLSLIKVDPKIKKINLVLNKLDIEQLKKISVTFKPSNFTSFLNNKIKKGQINTELKIYLDNNNVLENFTASGSVKNLKAEILKDINIEKTNFDFFADKTDILLKNISSDGGPFEILDGDLKIDMFEEISLRSNFKTKLKFNKQSKKYINLIKDFKYAKNIIGVEADLNNSLIVNFDKTYKVKSYNFKNNGEISKFILGFKDPINNYFLNEDINQLSLINSQIETNFNSKKNKINISGKYSINKDNPLTFNFNNTSDKKTSNIEFKADYKKPFALNFINYKKSANSVANIFIDFKKKKNITEIKKFNLIEGKNIISIENLKLNKNRIIFFKNLNVKTSKNGKINNNFSISFGKNILIKGNQFDASNLPKVLKEKTDNNQFSHITKKIEIDFTNIIAPLSENLKNFKLIGSIEKGKFTKISSKGDFGENNFLDITMKNDKKNNKKYLEIYSDLTAPLLTEYNFFKGLTGGKLLYTAIISKDNYNSKLKIEKFKVVNAPGMVKLFSLADLGGLADLAEGDGLSFDILEIHMEKDKNKLKLNEIIALGPSISVLMEGYQNSKITSLRGTLVPAKMLNRLISKIPVVGDIIIPKEAGEGLFGISFKIKGPQGKIKTSINPIRTVTPRFIQKIIDKNKGTK